MGSAISGLVVELFLQFYEYLIVKYMLKSNNIVFCNRYVDDILIIFDGHKITPEEVLNYMNNTLKHLEFKLTCE
jgi:hypothetical protein